MGNNIIKAQEYLAERFYTPSEAEIPLELVLPEFGGSAVLRYIKGLGTSRFLRTGLWQLDGSNELFFVKIFVKPNANWTVLSLIKSIKKDEEIIKEDRRLNHVLTATAVGENNKFAWYVRPYLPSTLSDKLRNGSFDLTQYDGQYILFQLLQIINALHECNIPCGGLNPNNILFTGDNMLWLSDCPFSHHVKPFKIPLYQPSPYMYYYESDSYYGLGKEGMRYLAPECYLSYDLKIFHDNIITSGEHQRSQTANTDPLEPKNIREDDILKDPILAVKERSRLSDLFSAGLIVCQLLGDLPSPTFGLTWMKNVIRTKFVIEFDLIRDPFLNTLLRTLLSFSPKDRDDLPRLLREGMLRYFPESFQQVLYPLSLQHPNESHTNSSQDVPVGKFTLPPTLAAMSTMQSKLHDEEVQLYRDLFLVEQNPVPLKLETSIVLFDRLSYIFETAKYGRTKLITLSIIHKMLIYSPKAHLGPQRQNLSIPSSNSEKYDEKWYESMESNNCLKSEKLQYYCFQKILCWILSQLSHYMLSNPKLVPTKGSGVHTKISETNIQMIHLIEVIFKRAPGFNFPNFQVDHYELCSQLAKFLNLVMHRVESESIGIDGPAFVLCFLLPLYMEGAAKHLAHDSTIAPNLHTLMSRFFKLADSNPAALIPVCVKIVAQLVVGPIGCFYYNQYRSGGKNEVHPHIHSAVPSNGTELKSDCITFDRFVFFQTLFRLRSIFLVNQNIPISVQHPHSNAANNLSQIQLLPVSEVSYLFGLLLNGLLSQSLSPRSLNQEIFGHALNVESSNRLSLAQNRAPHCICWVLSPLLQFILELKPEKMKIYSSRVILSFRWIQFALEILSIHTKIQCSGIGFSSLLQPVITLFRTYFKNPGDCSSSNLNQPVNVSKTYIDELLYLQFAILFAEMAALLSISGRSILRVLLLSVTFKKIDNGTNIINVNSSLNGKSFENRRITSLNNNNSQQMESSQLLKFRWQKECIRTLSHNLGYNLEIDKHIEAEKRIKLFPTYILIDKKGIKKPFSLPGVVPRVTRLTFRQARNQQDPWSHKNYIPGQQFSSSHRSFYRSIEPILQLYQLDQGIDEKSRHPDDKSSVHINQWYRREIEVPYSEDNRKPCPPLDLSLFVDHLDSFGWHSIAQYDHQLNPSNIVISIISRRRLFGSPKSQIMLKASDINLSQNHPSNAFCSSAITMSASSRGGDAFASASAHHGLKAKMIPIWQPIGNDIITDMAIQSFTSNARSTLPNPNYSYAYMQPRTKTPPQKRSLVEKKRILDDKSRNYSTENTAPSASNTFSLSALVVCQSGAVHELHVSLNIAFCWTKASVDVLTASTPFASFPLSASPQSNSVKAPKCKAEIILNSNQGMVSINIQQFKEKVLFQTGCIGQWILYLPSFFLLASDFLAKKNHLLYHIFIFNDVTNQVIYYDPIVGHSQFMQLSNSMVVQQTPKESALFLHLDLLLRSKGRIHFLLIGKDKFHADAFYSTDLLLGRLINSNYFSSSLSFLRQFPFASLTIGGFLAIDPSSSPYLMEILSIRLLSGDQSNSEFIIKEPYLFIHQMELLNGLRLPYNFSVFHTEAFHFVWILLLRRNEQILCLFAIHILSSRPRLLLQLLIVPSLLQKDEAVMKATEPSSLSYSTPETSSNVEMDPILLFSSSKLKLDDSICHDLPLFNTNASNMSPELPGKNTEGIVNDKESVSNASLNSNFTKWRFFLSPSDPLTSGTVLTLSNPLGCTLVIHLNSMIATVKRRSASNIELSGAVSNSSPFQKYQLNPTLHLVTKTDPALGNILSDNYFNDSKKDITEKSTLNMLPGFYLSCKLILPIDPD